MKFVATDGSVFTDRGLYRKHEMETQYTFRDKKSEVREHSTLGIPFNHNQPTHNLLFIVTRLS